MIICFRYHGLICRDALFAIIEETIVGSVFGGGAISQLNPSHFDGYLIVGVHGISGPSIQPRVRFCSAPGCDLDSVDSGADLILADSSMRTNNTLACIQLPFNPNHVTHFGPTPVIHCQTNNQPSMNGLIPIVRNPWTFVA